MNTLNFDYFVDQLTTREHISSDALKAKRGPLPVLSKNRRDDDVLEDLKHKLYTETLSVLISSSFFHTPILSALLLFELAEKQSDQHTLFSKGEQRGPEFFVGIQGATFSFPFSGTREEAEHKVIQSLLSNALVSDPEAVANCGQLLIGQLLELYRRRIELNGSCDALASEVRGFSVTRINESMFSLIKPTAFLASTLVSLRAFIRSQVTPEKDLASVIRALIPLEHMNIDQETLARAERNLLLAGAVYQGIPTASDMHAAVSIDSLSDPLFLALMSGYTPNKLVKKALMFPSKTGKNRDLDAVNRMCFSVLKTLIVLPHMNERERTTPALIRSFIQTKDDVMPSTEASNAFFTYFDLLQERNKVNKTPSLRAMLSQATADCFAFISSKHERNCVAVFMKHFELEGKNEGRVTAKLQELRSMALETADDIQYKPLDAHAAASESDILSVLKASITRFESMAEELFRANQTLLGEIDQQKTMDIRIEQENTLSTFVESAKAAEVAQALIKSVSDKNAMYEQENRYQKRRISELESNLENLRSKQQRMNEKLEALSDARDTYRDALETFVNFFKNHEDTQEAFEIAANEKKIQYILNLLEEAEESESVLSP